MISIELLIRPGKLLDIARLVLGNSPDQHYLQAIPLYMSSDETVATYFRDHAADIDAITGNSLIVALPEEVVAGNATAIAALFGPGVKQPRYPGLLRSDLPCFWLEDGLGGHEIVRLPDRPSEVNSYVRAMTDAIDEGGQKTAQGVKKWVLKRLQVDSTERSPQIRALLGELPVSKSTEKLIALIFGVIFVAAILALAVIFPQPTQFQYIVFRIVLAIAAAGFVSMTPGFLEITVSNWLRAGGALAVFVVVFFWNPAALVAPSPQVQAPIGKTAP
jgi:hypothetical protein